MAQKIPCYNLIRKGEQRENNIKNPGKVEMLSVSKTAQLSASEADLRVKFVHLGVWKSPESQVKSHGSHIRASSFAAHRDLDSPFFLQTPNRCYGKSEAWNRVWWGTWRSPSRGSSVGQLTGPVDFKTAVGGVLISRSHLSSLPPSGPRWLNQA